MTDSARRVVPSRGTVAGRTYLDLRALAKQNGRTSAEYLRLYALEGFLLRLAVSSHADTLVLKGGVLLAAYALRRPTADIDFAGLDIPNDIDHVRRLILEVAGMSLPDDDDDALRFDLSDVHAELIREDEEYSGVRVTIKVQLATARETFHVDVNVGDPIWPAPQAVLVPRLLGGDIALRGYPMAMVLAEKLVTAAQRGTASTRWRDFADVYLITGQHVLQAGEVRAALLEVARHRRTPLISLRFTLAGYSELSQNRWRRWRDRQHLQDRLPAAFAEVLEAVFAFADPLLSATAPATYAEWLPATRTWT